jgi:hypothetical protein
LRKISTDEKDTSNGRRILAPYAQGIPEAREMENILQTIHS